jgi:putative copper export protein
MSAALTGHARGSALPVPNLMVALIHVTAAAAWVGGLVALVTVAFPSVRGMMETDRAALLAPVVARFSDLAIWSVIAVVASGTYSAWMEIRGLDAVTASTYGLVFLAKLAAFLPVLALGGINNRWTKPRLVRAVRDQTPSLVLLRRMVALEIALIAVVLALTVFLLQLSPPAISAASQ